MSRRSLLIAGLLTATVAAVGATVAVRRVGSPSAVAAEQPLLLRVDEAKLDFGESWEASSFTFEFPIENFSDAPVRVTGWDRSCTCLAAEPETFTVGPGQKQTVRVKVVLTPQVLDPSAGQAVRPFATSLRAKSDGKPVSPNWTVQGKVRTVFRAAPSAVDFGMVSDLAKGPIESSFDIVPSVPLSSLTGVLEPPIGTVTVKTAGDNYTGRITLRLPAPLGEQKATLKLHAIGAGGEKLPVREVPVTLKGAPDVQPRYPRLLFGVVKAGETATGEIELYSLTGSSFEVRPFSKLPDGVTVTPRADDGRVAFDVSVKSMAVGPQSAPIEFRLRQPGRSEYAVVTELVYQGIP